MNENYLMCVLFSGLENSHPVSVVKWIDLKSKLLPYLES